MRRRLMSILVVGLILGLANLEQAASGGFESEPDKTMAAANEAFVKKNMNKAAEQIGKAATYVKTEADKVAKGGIDSTA